MNIAHLKIKEEKKLLSPVQKEFNRLNGKIERIKKNIEQIPVKINIIRTFQLEKLNPIKEKILQMQLEFIQKLDSMYDTTKLNTMQKEALALYIMEISDELLLEDIDSKTIDLLNDIYEKYNKITYSEKELEEMKTEENEMVKAMSEMLFGFDINDLSEDEAEDLLQKKMEEMLNQYDEEWEQHNKRKQNSRHNSKRAAAQQKREMEKKAEENATIKTLREIYTDLVKKLHPDLETDEKLRIEKTEQMKQITEAYENKDLATLLVMQINWLQNTDKNPQNQPDDVLAKYNKVLKMHIKKLEQEYNELIRSPFPFETDINPFGMLGATEIIIRKVLEGYEYKMNMKLKEEKLQLKKIGSSAGLKKLLSELYDDDNLDDDLYWQELETMYLKNEYF